MDARESRLVTICDLTDCSIVNLFLLSTATEWSDGPMFRKKRRFYRLPLNRRVAYAVLSIALSFRIVYLLSESTSENAPRLSTGDYVATDVADPCHLAIENQSGQAFNIRIIGIRAATREKAWLAATTFETRRLCLGRKVTIRLDKRRIDVDGTDLAHVYVGDELLSYQLVRNGIAVVHPTPSDSTSIIRQLNKAESIAKQERVGFWSKSPKPQFTWNRSLETTDAF